MRKSILEPLKFGIVGVGGMGGHHAATLPKLEETTLVAVSDVNAETAQKVAGETGATAYPDYKELIRKGGIEAVLIATPHFFHPPIAEYAARHGVHVLSEKPIAVSVSAADKMVKTCQDSGVQLGIMFQQRTDAARRKMKQMIDDGAIGPVHRVTMVSPWYRTQAYYDSGAWRGTWKGEGGGILMNQGPHSIDQFIWMGGMPKSVQGIATTRLHNIEVENTALSILDYGGGKLGWFYASTAELPGSERIEVAGDTGMLAAESGVLRHLVLERPMSDHLRTATSMFEAIKGEWHDVPVEEVPSGHTEVVRAFVRAVRENDSSLLVASGEDGLRSLELANAMLLAGYTRQEVQLPLDRGKFERMLKKLIGGAVPADFYKGK